ncbi:MAG: hypothetical protein J6N45_09480 [Alphaproteobacteria bacterium]|nr:hypothetical protein [Alphaproteobacteria bacterium]
METNKTEKRGVVILDIDGVVNSFSNRRFYLKFVKSVMQNLAKVHGRHKLVFAWPQLRKAGGPNSLFKFAKEYCGDDAKFNEFCKSVIKDLDFKDVAYDKSIRAMMKRLNRYGDIMIRSDGLTGIAAAVWQRVLENRPPEEIKEELLSADTLPKQVNLKFENHNIIVSGIEDNNMCTKTNIESWHTFAERYNIDISKSVLIDDSSANNKTAAKLGMKTIQIGKIDSFLKNTWLGNLQHRDLADILGAPISAALRHCKMAYGHKVDVAHLFSIVTDIPKDQLLKRVRPNQQKTEQKIADLREKLAPQSKKLAERLQQTTSKIHQKVKRLFKSNNDYHL